MNHRLKHRNAEHFRYEITTSRFTGSRSYAKRAFDVIHTPPVAPERFLDHLQSKKYRNAYLALEWVRFYSFKEGIRDLNLAVLNLAPDPTIRWMIFENREAITRATGWYPVVHGSRAHPSRLVKPSVAWVPSLGRLERLDAIANSGETGASFLLHGAEGDALFDFGFGTDSSANSSHHFAFRFLSHAHGDHSIGIWNALRNDNSPIFLSRTSVAFLTNFSDNAASTEALSRLTAIPDKSLLGLTPLSSGTRFFRVFHSPGSLGIQVNDTYGTSVTYFGDLCLRNGFHDFSQEALDIVTAPQATNRWVMLDATFAGRKRDSIEATDSPENILKDIATTASKRTVFFVNKLPEPLIYSYLQAFLLTRSPELHVPILLTQDLYKTLGALWLPVIRRSPAEIDPFIQAQLGSHTANFAESYRFYPLSASVLKQLPPNMASIIFCKPEDFDLVEGLTDRVKSANLVLTGALARESGLDSLPMLAKTAPRTILRVDTPDWSFHSDEDALAEFVRDITSRGGRVVLFHNHSSSLDRFIKKYNFDTSSVLRFSSSKTSIQLA